MAWLELLRRSGRRAEIHTGNRLVLWVDDHPQQFRLLRRTRSPRPSEITAPPSPHTVLWIPRLTAPAERALRQHGWSWVSDDGHLHLNLSSGPLDLPAPETDALPPGLPQQRLRTAPAALAVLRILLEQPTPLRQIDIASRAGVTQARVSQVLTTLTDQDLVRRTSQGWQVEAFDAALDWWLQHYPGPGGITTFWYGLQPIPVQADTAVRALSPGRAAVSGDAAADVLAPWRRPTQAVIYAQTSVDLEPAGLVATTADQASLRLVVPTDPTVFTPPATATRITDSTPWPLAALSQVLWDLRASAASDAPEAADMLRHAWRQAQEDRCTSSS